MLRVLVYAERAAMELSGLRYAAVDGATALPRDLWRIVVGYDEPCFRETLLYWLISGPESELRLSATVEWDGHVLAMTGFAAQVDISFELPEVKMGWLYMRSDIAGKMTMMREASGFRVRRWSTPLNDPHMHFSAFCEWIEAGGIARSLGQYGFRVGHQAFEEQLVGITRRLISALREPAS
jgi:hypothetical protein